MLVSADAQNQNLIIHWGMQSGAILILFFFHNRDILFKNSSHLLFG